MSMKSWAEREVEIACKHENPDRKEGEWDYGCACYESALKAFKSLMEDEIWRDERLRPDMWIFPEYERCD